MSVEQLDVVDIISINETGEVVLAISDHLAWTDSVDHQTKLQAKLNKYLAFIESGELLQRYAEAKDRVVVIRVFFKYPPNEKGQNFLDRAKEVIEKAGFQLRHEVFDAA